MLNFYFNSTMIQNQLVISKKRLLIFTGNEFEEMHDRKHRGCHCLAQTVHMQDREPG